MTQEDKELLLRDLCARLPYGVKMINTDPYSDNHNPILTLSHISEDNAIGCRAGKGFMTTSLGSIKPYLFPLPNMTEEQEEELITITNGKFRYMWGDINNAIPRKNTSEWGISENAFINSIEVINILYTWLLKNHFDINGLIPIGLALDATGLNIY